MIPHKRKEKQISTCCLDLPVDSLLVVQCSFRETWL